jgi:hypothetical protein
MRLRIPLLALATTGLMAAAACDEKLATVAGPTPNLEPSFTSVQREIFQTTDSAGRVLCVGCHTDVGRNPSAGLNLRTEVAHANLVNVGSRNNPGKILVIPGDPENSYLIHKLEGRPGIVGQRMPRTAGPFLTEGQILIIRRWIALGARND